MYLDGGSRIGGPVDPKWRRGQRGAQPSVPPWRTWRKPWLGPQLKAPVEGIVTGHSAMPEFTFAPDEIDALLTYIGSLGQGAPAKTKP